MRRPVLVLIALVALGVSAACSSGGEPPDDYDAAVVRDGLAALFAGDHPEAQDAEAGACFAEAFTEGTTPEELRAAGLLDERYDVVAVLPTLAPEVAEAWADAQFACTDFVEESTRAQIKVTKGRLDPDAYAACLRGLMSDADLRAAVVETLTGQWDGEHVSRLGAAQSDCVDRSQGTPAGG